MRVQRPCVLVEPNDPACATLDDQYFVGDDVLVAPAFNEAGDRSVYLPRGTWYDFFSSSVVSGPRTVERRGVPWNQLPVYVRAGAIVPLGPEMSWSGEKPVDPLTVRYYAGDGTSSYSLYEDDGESAAPVARRTVLTVVAEAAHLRFTAHGEGAPARAAYRLEITGRGTPRRVTANGHAVVFTPVDGRIVVTVPAEPTVDVEY